MKKHILCIIFLSIFSLSFSQNDDKENSLGITFQPIALSDAYSFGIGLTLHEDFSSDGKGFGGWVNLVYLSPDEILKDVIDYTLQFDVAFNYDFVVTNGFKIYPSVGAGYISSQLSNGDSTDTEFYFVSGAGLTYSLGRTIKIGLDVYKAFLENSNIIISPSIRFQI